MGIFKSIARYVSSSIDAYLDRPSHSSDWLPMSGQNLDSDSWENEQTVSDCRNVSKIDFIDGAIKREKTNTIQSGITVKTPNPEFNDLYTLWSSVPNFFDYTGEKSLKDICRLIVKAWRTDGECFAIRHYSKDSGFKIPICFEVVPVDSLDTTRDNGDDIVRGIKYNNITGRKESYYFFKDSSSFKSRPIKAEDVVHIPMISDLGCRRGAPTLGATAQSVRDVKQYVDFEKLAAKVFACISLFLETDSPEAYRKLKEEGKLPLPQFMQPGKIFALPHGTSVTNSGQNRPATSFQPFVQSMLQFVSSGLNHAYPNLSGDYARSSYSSAKMATIEERMYFKMIQDELIDKFIKPVVFMFASAAKIRGLLPMSEDLYSFVYLHTTYLPQGFDLLDPLKEAKAISMLLESKVVSLTKVLGDRGTDFNKHMEQLKEEAEQMLELEKINSQINALRGNNG